MKLTEDLKKNAYKYRSRLLSATSACRTADEVKISDIKPGQLWKVVYGAPEDAEAIFAILTSVPFKEQGSLEKAIRIVPIFCSPSPNCICPKTDLIISDTKFLGGVSSLLEWWNERPVKLSQLNTVFGNLSEQHLKRLTQLLTTEPLPESTKVELKLFREEEKALGALVSSAYFDDLLCPNEAKSAEKGWLESAHEWLKQSFFLGALQPAYYCSEPGHSPEFKHCRAQLIRIIEEINRPDEITAFTTLTGLSISFCSDAPIRLIFFDKNDRVLLSAESKNGKIALREDELESWGLVAGFKFIPPS